MLRTLLRDETNSFSVVEDPTAISEIVLGRDRLLWLDLERPTREEFALIQEEFGLHPLGIEDAMSRHQRPKVDQYTNSYLVIFYTVAFQEPGAKLIPGRRGLSGSSFVRHDAPDMDQAENSDHADASEEVAAVSAPLVEHEGEHIAGADDERIVLNELTLFLGENFLVTIHDNPIPELDEAARRWTQNVEAISAGLASAGSVPGTRRLRPGEDRVLNSNTAPENGATQTHDPQASLADEHGESTPEHVHLAKSSGTHPPRDVGILLYSLLDTIVDN